MHPTIQCDGPPDTVLKAHGLEPGLVAQALLEASSRGCLMVGRDGTVVMVNSLAQTRLAVPVGSRLARTLPELARRTEQVLAGQADPGGPLLQREGLPFKVSVAPLRAGDEVQGVLISFADLASTGAGVGEHNLELAREQDAIMDTLADGVWICDNQGYVLRINPAAERLNMIRAEDVVGRNVRELIAEGLFDRSVALEVLERKGPVSMLQKGRGHTFLLTGTPVLNDQGEIVRVVTTEREGTQIEALLKELEEQELLREHVHDHLVEQQLEEVLSQQVIAKSECMRKALSHALKVAKAGSTVLILGESGVGKELFADIIYKYSGLTGKPFVKLNCGAIPEPLLEAELFGYDKGAFTGAQAKGKPGHLELADGGMIFLDEVAELPLSAQVKLLRFLENGWVTRVGATQGRKLKVRILAATHKDLKAMVATGTFRLDLYYRLSVIPIFIPPLRARTECILPLLHHFVDLFDARAGVRRRLSRAATEALLAYPWPGNVRELANLCERVVVMSESELIGLSELPSEFLGGHPAQPQAGQEALHLDKARAGTERALLLEARQHYRTQAMMAKALGINQSTVARKLKRYGIS